MGLLQDLEKKLEGLVEGIFSARFPSALEPVELARLLDRKMREQRRVGLGSTLAPNRYQVRLSPEDYESFSALGSSLREELEKYVESNAREEGYRLPGRAHVLFESDPSLRLGEAKITASSLAEPDQPHPQESDRARHVSAPAPERTFVIPPASPSRRGGTQIIERQERLASLRLPREMGGSLATVSERTVIGRSRRCDVVLTIPEVSREHAVIERRQGRFILSDLDSTNGTYLNGKRIEESPLAGGDRIRLGPVELVFLLEETPRSSR